MSTYDPRIVAQALGDLQEQLTRWSSIASETLAAATETQRYAKEAVDRAIHNASILLNRAQDDEESVQKAISSVEVAIEKCATAKSTANQTLQEAQTILKHAIITLQKWEAELEKALAWLARAEARLDKAIREYERARQALSSAEWDLSSAESRYRNCMNNSERRDCGSEAAAVRRAQTDVASARTWVAVAEQEVIAAKEEVEQAKARVACCQQAVASATQAVNLAQEAESDATQAVNSAERGLEFAQAAERLVRVAQDKVVAEVEGAESMMTDTRAAFSLTDEAAIHLRTADAAEDSAQTYSTTARKELEHRVQLLYELNRPTIGGASVARGTSTTASLGRWVDRGIQLVNIADLPEPADISSSDDFKKISETEMRAGIEKWLTMKPVIENGVGTNSDYWAEFDRQQDLDYANGYRRVYDAFYGQDCIKVDKVGSSYDIINGRHRIWLAKRMGIEQLPMCIVEKK